MTTLNWPNRMTVVRIALIAPFVVCLLSLGDPRWSDTARRAALGIFAVMAVTDGLDGFLARRLRCETPLGRFLDPIADKLLVLCAVVLLAHETTSVPDCILPGFVLVAAIGKDLLVVVGFCIVYIITSRPASARGDWASSARRPSSPWWWPCCSGPTCPHCSGGCRRYAGGLRRGWRSRPPWITFVSDNASWPPPYRPRRRHELTVLYHR